MRSFVIALFMLAALSFPRLGAADLYEETRDRPASSGQHENEYVEDDTDQIIESFWPSMISRRSYNVYLPGGDTDPVSYEHPAILLLHGAGRSGASLVERWREIADQNDVILLGPHASGRWSISDAQGFMPALIKDASKKYKIDPDHIYVFGHSMGGSFALILASMMSDTFAAVGVHAGKFSGPNAMQVVAQSKRKIPLIMINGTRDKGFPVNQVRASAKAYANYDHEVELYILQNHGHWYYDIAPSINDMAWEFFRYKSL